MPAKTSITFTHLSNRVVIEPDDEQDQVSPGGIYIPDTAKEKPQEGQIIAVGPGKLDENGKRIPMEVKVGDRVIYSKYAGTEYKQGTTEYLVVREEDILLKR